jgi:hypothetical protein
MSTAERPPAELFCMTCGPDETAERIAAWIRPQTVAT